jgi:hypothetical protein
MATPNNGQVINIGPQDVELGMTQALPAAGANVTTNVIDIQAVAPNSNAWRLGRFQVNWPALPENTGATGITIALQAAGPSLTTGSAAAAPQIPGPAAFVTPTRAQTITIAPVAGTGSIAGAAWFNLEFDPYGSTYEFYQFLITTPAGTVTVGELISIQFVWDTD